MRAAAKLGTSLRTAAATAPQRSRASQAQLQILRPLSSSSWSPATPRQTAPPQHQPSPLSQQHVPVEEPAAAPASAVEGFEQRVAALVDEEVVLTLDTAVPADTAATAAATSNALAADAAPPALPSAALLEAVAASLPAPHDPRTPHAPKLAAQVAVPPDRLAQLDFTSPDTYRGTMLPPHEAFTVTPAAYASQACYDVEAARVYGKSWVCIGSAQDVRQPGDTIVAEVGGQPIFAVRDKAGALNGFLNVCRHRGSKLVRAAGRNPVISCPYHRWGYALDGRLLATPLWDTVEGGARVEKGTGERKAPAKSKRRGGARERSDAEAAAWVAEAENAAAASERLAAAVTGGSAPAAAAAAEAAFGVAGSAAERAAGCAQMQSVMHAYDTAHIVNFDKKDFSLFRVRVEEWGSLVFATLAPEDEVPPLQTCLGDVPAQLANYPLHELVRVRSKTYESRANWKLLAENFMEYLHLPTVHPALCKVSAVDDHHRRQGPGQYVGFVTSPLTNGGTPIDPDVLPAFPGLQGAERMTAVFHHLFPNVFYFMLPSHVFVVRLDPRGPARTVEHAELLLHPSLVQAHAGDPAQLDAKLDAMMEFYDMTNLEDIDACELVQEGVQAAAYRGGRVSFRFEETIHRFQNIWIDHMTGFPGRVPKGDADIPFYVGGQSALDAIDLVHDVENRDMNI